jgi:uncharacterized protein (TIGR02246 family)
VSLEEDLDRHLTAIRARDLDALADTVHADDVVLVTSAGAIHLGRQEFLDAHRDWFASTTWTLETDLIHLREGTDLATVLLSLRYRDGDIDESSVLSLVFRNDAGRWLMVQDQNTPVRPPAD